MRAGSLAIALAVLLAGLVTGCGGQSEKAVTKVQYEQRIDQLGRDLYSAANDLGKSSNTEIFIDGVDKLEQVVSDGADALDAMRPPGPAAQAANDRLVRAYRALKHEFEKVKDARRVSYPRALDALKALQTSTPAKETIRAARELRKLGFKVPVFATVGSSA
jgi:hypothetical protein